MNDDIAHSPSPIIRLDNRLKAAMMSRPEEEGIVILHCTFPTSSDVTVRTWRSAILVDHDSGAQARILHALYIPLSPRREHFEAGSARMFTLIFSSLPKSCRQFDLVADTECCCPFNVYSIRRNGSDVYHVQIA